MHSRADANDRAGGRVGGALETVANHGHVAAAAIHTAGGVETVSRAGRGVRIERHGHVVYDAKACRRRRGRRRGRRRRDDAARGGAHLIRLALDDRRRGADHLVVDRGGQRESGAVGTVANNATAVVVVVVVDSVARWRRGQVENDYLAFFLLDNGGVASARLGRDGRRRMNVTDEWSHLGQLDAGGNDATAAALQCCRIHDH